MAVKKLNGAQLRLCCDTSQFDFETTAGIESLGQAIGQARASEAMGFAIAMKRPGYNLFALGPTGMGKHYVVRQFLEKASTDGSVPPDWCYVNDFANPHRPIPLQLPAGTGVKLRDAVESTMRDVWAVLASAYGSDDYGSRRRVIEELIEERQNEVIADLQEDAEVMGVNIMRSAGGLALVPVKDGVVLEKEGFDALPDDEREAADEALEIVRDRLSKALAQEPVWEREQRELLRELDEETARWALGDLFSDLGKDWPDEVVGWLDGLEADIVRGGQVLLEAREDERENRVAGLPRVAGLSSRYAVNVIVDNSGTEGAPVIYEDHPSVANLLGRVEHLNVMGASVTDVTFIRSGALHRALGGYLVLDARKLMAEPHAWEQLKRALRSRLIRVGSIRRLVSDDGAVSLEPEPIALDVKVVLVGERHLYYALNATDPDFPQLFKVAADFDEALPRTPENVALYAQLVGTLAAKSELRPLTAGAVGLIVERAARRSGYRNELTMHIASTFDLLREADYCAGLRGAKLVESEDVDAALGALLHRHRRIQERSAGAIARGEILVSTSGSTVGQINGLSILSFGPVEFGKPARITATWRIGPGEVVDIEREVYLGGNLHSKGVLILSGYLGARYGQTRPLALTASIVMEQSYGEVDGDSASLAELCALLSALSDIPIKQSIAVTGSVNQRGDVQAIGGVNIKIEGFFDLCASRGFEGQPGCVIPAANRDSLMLRRDVVEACQAGRFSVWAVATVDEALKILLGRTAKTVHAAVGATLEEAARCAQRYRAQ
jgi:lon-related putative ATP-dependent protease